MVLSKIIFYLLQDGCKDDPLTPGLAHILPPEPPDRCWISYPESGLQNLVQDVWKIPGVLLIP